MTKTYMKLLACAAILVSSSTMRAEVQAHIEIQKIVKLIHETADFDKNDKKTKAKKNRLKMGEILDGLKGKKIELKANCVLIKSIVGWGQYAYSPKCAGIEKPTIGESILAFEFSKSNSAILEKVDDLKPFQEFSVAFTISDWTNLEGGSFTKDHVKITGRITKILSVTPQKKAEKNSEENLDSGSQEQSSLTPAEVLRKLKDGETVEKEQIIKTLEQLLEDKP